MRVYKLTGYIQRKGTPEEEQDWEKLDENLLFKLPDEVEPWQAVNGDLMRIASHWLITLDELEEEAE